MGSFELIFDRSGVSGIRVVFVTKGGVRDASDYAYLEAHGFECEGVFYVQSSRTLYVGVDEEDESSYTSGSSAAIRYLRNIKAKECYVDQSVCDSFHEQILYGLILGSYKFSRYISSVGKRGCETQRVVVGLSGMDWTMVEKVRTVAHGVFLVRDLVNTPPNYANSEYMVEFIKNELNNVTSSCPNAEVKCDIYSNDFLQKENMGAFLAVNRASEYPAYLVHLSYRPKESDKTLKKVVVVGKGLVYDTGGLSLKPSDYMTTMKADKAGACACFGSFVSIAKLGLNIEFHAILGITDNSIGCKAYRPDDVVTSREGKTIEIKNTDAEGRLVLVDCLSYAQDLKPDILIDFATLTGACVVALGEYTSGVMGFNAKLRESFVESSMSSGELAHSLPFNKYLKKLLKSDVADLSNVSASRYGGAITAGLFLGEFIRNDFKDKWIHVDMAGPAFVEKEWGENPGGASGVGVRSCIKFVQKIIEEGI